MRNAADAGQALEGFIDARGIGNFDDQPVGGLGDAADFGAVQRAAQTFAQFVQEETAVAALEPELVVVNDDVRGGHDSHGHSRWMRVVYSRLRVALQGRWYLTAAVRWQARPFGPVAERNGGARRQSSELHLGAKQTTP